MAEEGEKGPMESQIVGRNLIVRLHGELDLVSAGRFRDAVDDVLDRDRAFNLYVNLAGATFIDSSFLGALLGRYRRIHQAGGRMGLIATPGPIRPTLELSGLLRTMPGYRSEEEALAGG